MVKSDKAGDEGIRTGHIHLMLGWTFSSCLSELPLAMLDRCIRNKAVEKGIGKAGTAAYPGCSKSSSDKAHPTCVAQVLNSTFLHSRKYSY